VVYLIILHQLQNLLVIARYNRTSVRAGTGTEVEGHVSAGTKNENRKRLGKSVSRLEVSSSGVTYKAFALATSHLS
jgi:hypothetical protein